MQSQKLVIRSQNLILQGGMEPQPASLQIIDGKIVAIGRYSEHFENNSLDFGHQLVLPGIVDTHAHINEPGRTEWEGFRTATRAAAAGGVTTVIDMPLNSIPATTSLEALKIKTQSAHSQCSIDYGFWGGIIPGNQDELQSMIDAGVMGFKCFLIDSGVPEFPAADEATLRKSMPILAAAGLPLIVHAELCASPEFDLDTVSPNSQEIPQTYSSYLTSRP
ncbi:MAG: amidohydrolase family protein, partial [Bdellovibrionia bacterium]